MRITDVWSAAQTDSGVELRKVGEGIACLKCDTPFVATRNEVFPKPVRALKRDLPPPTPNGALLSKLEKQLNIGEE